MADEKITEMMEEFNSGVMQMVSALREAVEELKNPKPSPKPAPDSEETNKTLKKFGNDLKKVGSELTRIAEAGIRLGQSLGVSATQGVALEFKNRLNSIKSLGAFNANLVVTTEQLKGAQQGFADVFMGAREGMQISADGSRAFVQDLKKGFGSEFQPTAETFRMLTQMGMSTTTQFDAFRKSTGRASLSNQQLATLYGKNTLSFLLYGNSFGKAAVQAERLGVNLASVLAAQEGLVTNLDGTIDTVAQMNQLGANIDFGNLVRIAETEGPDALMAYVRRTVPEQMMQSASTRALFKQLGISVEDYMKSGQKQVSAADQLEARMSEQADNTGKVNKGLDALGKVLTWVSRGFINGMAAFGGLTMAAFAAASSLAKLALAGPSTPGGLGASAAGPAGAAAPALTRGARMAAGAGTGLKIGGPMAAITGLMSGYAEYQQTGSLGAAFGKGIANAAGSIIGGILGGAIGGAFSFGLAAPIGASVGALAGGMAGDWIYNTFFKKADDMMSPGYGSRSLVTPTGVYALNNADDVIAGTKLFPKDALQFKTTPSVGGTTDRATSDLVRKVDALISAMEKANMTIDINGSTQQVPRMSVKTVQVLSRNER